MPDLIGQTIGKYRVVARLGRGGMAEVYKAYQPGLDRYVAIKVLHSHLAEDADFIGRFEREARAVANLRHPNIVQVFDFDIQNQMYYMAMEYIDGPTLKAELMERSQKGQLFDLGETARLMIALCGAIDYAHSHGMVHRDLKPANFILTQDGQILILDFGIAKIVGATQYTVTGAMSGTPAYMSPEQGQGKRGDERSDIYSLGVVLYEMVTGKVPFDADTPFAVIMKHISDPLPMPKTLNPTIPENLERIILRALSKNPEDRFQSGAEFATALRDAVGLSPYDTLIKNPVTTIAPVSKLHELQPTDPSFKQSATPTNPINAAPAQTVVDTAAPVGQSATVVAAAPKASNLKWIIGGALAVIVMLATVLAGIFIGSRQNQVPTTTNPETQAAAIVPPTESPTVEPTSTPALPPTDTPDIEAEVAATVEARLTASAVAVAVETADAVATEAKMAPTDTPTLQPTYTPLPTNTAIPTDTPVSAPPTATSVPATPTPAASPTSAPPEISGRIAIPIEDVDGFFDVWLYDITTGEPTLKFDNARQPAFRSDGIKMLVNGEGGGRDDVWEVDATTGNFDKPVSGSPTDSHPFYSPWGDRLVYGNPNLAIGSDGSNHPFIFVQCSLNRPQDEPESTCSDVARFGVLVPNGQIGEIHGSSPVWTDDDRIVYKGCNTWAGGNSCGIFIVGSWANKKNSNGETPAKLSGVDGTSTTPTDAEGNMILFHAFENNNWDVFLTTVGGGKTNLTNTPGANEGLGTFSPDGQWVAFVSDQGGSWAVWTVPASGGTAAKLFDLPGSPWGTGDHDWTNERISWGP